MSKRHCKRAELFRVKKTLEEAIILTRNNEKSLMRRFKDLNISEDDKYLKFEWRRDINFKIENIDIKSGYRMIKLNAYIEKKGNIKYDAIILNENQIMSKSLWLRSSLIPVYFIEKGDYLYVILLGSDNDCVQVKNKLMKLGKPDSIWGEIERYVLEYNFDSKFFYWVIFRNGVELNNDEDSVKITNIKGFDSTEEIFERNYSGEGDNIDNSDIFKMLVSDENVIESLYIRAIVKNMKFGFWLKDSGEVRYNESECLYINQELGFLSEKTILMNIYFGVLPKLRGLYNDYITEYGVEFIKTMKKESAIELITKLISSCNIDIEELKCENERIEFGE